MRVVVFGYMTWGHRTLEAVLDAGHAVPLVVTHPDGDDPYEQIFNDSVADLACRHGIPVSVRTRADDAEIAARVAAARADAIVVANWRTRIPPTVYDVPRLGTLNVHDSLLPAYAGFAPLNWALINGEPEVGVTAHLMNAEFDAGDIVLQRATPVGDEDTIVELFDRTLAMFGPIAVESLALLAGGRTDWAPQNRRKASYFHRRGDAENRIDWSWPARDIANLVRAQTDPYPNAYCFHNGHRLHVLEARVTETCFGGTPGRISLRDDRGGVVVVAGPRARKGQNPGLSVRRVRTEDGRVLTAAEYFVRLGGYLT
ncbi:MAG: methionyl-tRNA formyltransferase [Pseudonocardia sp.]|nr:methionyl-tRNA formyltransferase [Pseudonocardia sp.]